MIKSQDFISYLESFEFSPFLMVPCSIFKPLNAWLVNHEKEVIFPPNEAHAVGFAVGTYCATGKPASIFLQNSGLNNIANAQTSLNYLYKVPVLLVVSWRGEPGKNDAPEHKLMGEITPKFLKILKIPALVLSPKWKKELEETINFIIKKRQPAAVIVREGEFENENFVVPDLAAKYPLSRLETIKIIKTALENKAVFISTNGFTSRDSFAADATPDFYMMGSMGHAFSIGTGTVWSLAKRNSKLRVVVFDGDGGCLMHLGSLALVNLVKKSNLIYVVLDNEAYESTGSQPTLSPGIDFIKAAEGLGFPQRFLVKNSSQLKKALSKIRPQLATFIQIKVNRRKAEGSARVSDYYTCEQITQRFKKNFQFLP